MQGHDVGELEYHHIQVCSTHTPNTGQYLSHKQGKFLYKYWCSLHQPWRYRNTRVRDKSMKSR